MQTYRIYMRDDKSWYFFDPRTVEEMQYDLNADVVSVPGDIYGDVSDEPEFRGCTFATAEIIALYAPPKQGVDVGECPYPDLADVQASRVPGTVIKPESEG